MEVLVLGPTGTIGPHVVAGLVERGERPRVLARRPEHAASLLPDEVTIVPGDFTRGDDLDRAMDGIDSVFLLTPHGEEMAELQTAVVDRAAAGGAKLVKISGTHSGIRPDGPDACRDHWQVEERIRERGVRHAILRPNAFMQTLIGRMMMASVAAEGVIRNPIGDAGLSFVDATDIARCAVVELLDPDRDEGTYVLTGPTAPTFADVRVLLESAVGRSIELIEIEPEDVEREMLARGLSTWEARHFREMFALFGRGESEYLGDGVERLTGKAPNSVERYVAGGATG